MALAEPSEVAQLERGAARPEPKNPQVYWIFCRWRRGDRTPDLMPETPSSIWPVDSPATKPSLIWLPSVGRRCSSASALP